MNVVTCPRCRGVGEELVPGDECGPDEWRPCGLCHGIGRVEDGVASLYEAGLWAYGKCGECGLRGIVVETADADLCATCAMDVASIPF